MEPSFDELVQRAGRLVRPGRRAVLGIAGGPAAGKSTLSSALSRALDAPVVEMDAFHLPDEVLRELGRLDRKGAPDTFDAPGYVELVARLHSLEEIRAPVFDRGIEASVPDAVVVAADAPLVITEGNYLLLDQLPWSRLELDETWFVETPEQLRVERLVARHMSYGWPADFSWQRATEGSDAANAALVAPTRSQADLVVHNV